MRETCIDYAVISLNLCSPRETVCLKKRSIIQINISLSCIAFPGQDTEHISTFVSSKKLTDAEWEQLKSEAGFTDGDDQSFEVPF